MLSTAAVAQLLEVAQDQKLKMKAMCVEGHKSADSKGDNLDNNANWHITIYTLFQACE